MRIVSRTRIGKDTFLYTSYSVLSIIWLFLGLCGIVYAIQHDIIYKFAQIVVAVISVLTIFVSIILFASCKHKKEVLGAIAIALAFGGVVAFFINLL